MSANYCPLDVLTRPDLKSQQLYNLRRVQQSVRGKRGSNRSKFRTYLKMSYFGACSLMAAYVVLYLKHIDYKTLGREFVFDNTYGFHAKILKRMKFELETVTIEDYEKIQKKKEAAVQKLVEACRKQEITLNSKELQSPSVTTHRSAKARRLSEQVGVLEASKKQRILRKKFQQKFEDAKQRFIIDERKKYKDEEIIVVAEIRRIENETKTNGYHRKLLSKFKEEPGGGKPAVVSTKTFKSAHSNLDFGKINKLTGPSKGLLDVHYDSKPEVDRDLKHEMRSKMEAIKAVSTFSKSGSEHAKLRKKPKQIFNKVTQQYDDVEDDDDDD